jgi:hypothetical protein
LLIVESADELKPRAKGWCIRQVMTVTGDDSGTRIFSFPGELTSQGGLANTGFTAEEYQLASTLEGIFECFTQECLLL